MEHQYQPGAAETMTKTKSAARKAKLWWDIFNNLFYVVAVLALLAFAYYLFSFQHLLLLYLPIFLQATVVTLVLALVSLFFAVIFGLIGAMGRLSRNRVIYAIATTYVEVIRGTPVLVQLLLWYFAVSLLF